MRKHRKLDGSTGKVTVVTFTEEEEAAADKIEADAAGRKLIKNSDAGRFARAFTDSDKDIILFKTLLLMKQQLNAIQRLRGPTEKQFIAELITALPELTAPD